ncbi:septum formation initiator family protein [Candidatus Curtissbacteria bacterium]|nr:septum formation initiator family protein [Candidatus Curtissbacteria bacterium]
MARNLLLFFAVLAGLLLVINGTKRILTLRTTSQKVGETEGRLKQLKEENQALKAELEYKKSGEFAEQEIRNKLGYAKEGEAVVLVPKTDDERLTTNDERDNLSNWQKWWEFFFGS